MGRPFLALLAGLLALACAAAGEAAGLTVSAAVSLKESFQEIARGFEADHPGYPVAVNFASSGHLQRQIERGAPVDVFASAATRPMDALEKARRILPRTRRIFAANRLVLVRSRGSAAVTSFSSLGASFEGRLAIGNPLHVPAGDYAKQVLESLGYWKTLRPRLILAEHVRQVLDYVARGEVDAGMVYRTDVLRARVRVEVVEEAPSGSHKPIVYPIAVVAETHSLEWAEAFVRFVLSAKGRSILARAGFGPPP